LAAAGSTAGRLKARGGSYSLGEWTGAISQTLLKPGGFAYGYNSPGAVAPRQTIAVNLLGAKAARFCCRPTRRLAPSGRRRSALRALTGAGGSWH
jgi:hypothetical protein